MENLKRTQKAWTINLDKIAFGYDCCPHYVYAETISKAKLALLKIVQYDDYKLNYGGDEVTYLNIPVIRAPKMDKYEFEDGEFTKYQIEDIIFERERLKKYDDILKDDKITHCYIMKRGSYYMDNSCGYTEIKSKAGIYTKEKAIQDGKTCRELTIIPISTENHNRMIETEINNLKKRMI